MSDILFKKDSYIFSYRIGGVLIHDGKMLFQRVPGDEGYALPGGHVAFGETSEEALKREFKEELHAEIKVERLLMFGENFLPWGALPCQQVNLFYQVSLCDETQLPLEGTFYGYDELGNARYEVEFAWVPLEQLDDIVVYPTEAKDHLLSLPDGIVHFVHKE